MAHSIVPSSAQGALIPGGAHQFHRAYEEVQPELATLRSKDLVSVNLDISSAVTQVIGCWPQLQTLLPEMALLHGLDFERVAKVHTYALATWCAGVQVIATSRPFERIEPLVEELSRVRAVLTTDARALVQRGLLSAEPLRQLHSSGHKNLAFDVLLLTSMFLKKWPLLEGKTAVDMSQIVAAEELASRLVVSVSLRARGRNAMAEVLETRKRAFTLFTKTHDEARRAVLYLRHHQKDADRFAPSLYRGRGGSRRKKEEVKEAEKETLTLTSSALVVSPPATTPFQSLPTAAPGMPGHHPFGGD